MKMLLLCSFIFIVLFGLYQVYVVSPRDLQVQKQGEQDARSAELSSCLSAAELTYQTNWANDCDAQYNKCIDSGTESTICSQNYPVDSNCTLNATEAKRWDDILQEDKQNCFQEYPQN